MIIKNKKEADFTRVKSKKIPLLNESFHKLSSYILQQKVIKINYLTKVYIDYE